MSMKESEIRLVKRSWKVFREMDPAVIGDAFYSKLFSRNHSLRKMFPDDMTQQYQKLIAMINIIIARIDRPEELEEQVSAMARRHVQYGVRPAHYKLVGDALLWTLQQGLGNDWTPEVGAAWSKCYSFLAESMICASKIIPVK